MSKDAVFERLRRNSAFGSLPASSLDVVASVSDDRFFAPNESLLREGEQGRDLFLLLEGEARAFRRSEDGADIALNTMSEGDCIGELSLIDDAPRTASVRAVERCHVVHVRVDDIRDVAVINDLRVAFAQVVVQRTRTLSNEMLVGMQAQLEARTRQNQFGTVLVFTIAMLLLTTSLLYLVAEDYVADAYSISFSWQTLLVFAVPCLAIIFYLRIPPDQLGLRRERLGRSIVEGVALSAVLCAPVALYLLIFRDAVPVEDRPVEITTLFLVQYFFHTALQELGARGLVQGLFVRFLDDRKGHRAVFLSSMIFASMHVTLGASGVVLSFFASLVFGYLYLYQKNLAGVIIVHYCLGVAAAFLAAL